MSLTSGLLVTVLAGHFSFWEKGGDAMVTLSDLFEFVIMLCTVVALVISVINKKK